MKLTLIASLLLISCKSKIIYVYDYCAIKDVRLTEKSKLIEPIETKRKIIFNNLLREENCIE